jgi:hypothetical protein
VVPEWNVIVRGKLKDLGLGVRQQEEVADELADHLEDIYEQFLEEGLCEPEALRLTLQEAADWRKLARNIRRARRKEDVMNNRTKTLWLPGLAALTAASVSLMLLERIVMLQPRLWWKDSGVLAIHASWWILLPLCGAAGAYLSRRGGGQRLARLAAGLFPAIIMLCVFCFVLPVSVLIERNAFVMQHPLYFLLALINWTVVPGLALLLGTLPFLRTPIVNRS